MAFLTQTQLPAAHVFFDGGQFARIGKGTRRIMVPFLYLAIKSLYWSQGGTLKKILWCDDDAIKPYFIADAVRGGGGERNAGAPLCQGDQGKIERLMCRFRLLPRAEKEPRQRLFVELTGTFWCWYSEMIDSRGKILYPIQEKMSAALPRKTMQNPEGEHRESGARPERTRHCNRGAWRICHWGNLRRRAAR